MDHRGGYTSNRSRDRDVKLRSLAYGDDRYASRGPPLASAPANGAGPMAGFGGFSLVPPQGPGYGGQGLLFGQPPASLAPYQFGQPPESTFGQPPAQGYQNDRVPQGDRNERSGANDRYSQHDRYPQGDRYPQNDRYSQSDRYNDRSNDRPSDRPDRPNDRDRYAQNDRYPQNDRYSQSDRYPQNDRYSRDRARGPRYGQDRYRDSDPRDLRYRSDRGRGGRDRGRDRFDSRPSRDRGDRSDRSDRPSAQRLRDPEADLAKLADVPSLEQLQPATTRWGQRAPGFENVPAVTAKMLGHFPPPGTAAGPDTMSTAPQLLNKSHIDPIDSVAAKTLVVDVVVGQGTALGLVNLDRIGDFVNDYLKSIDVPQTLAQLITAKQPTQGRLVCHTANAVCATIALTLNGITLPYNLYKRDHAAATDDKITLRFTRPREYVVQAPASDGGASEVAEGPKKLVIHVSPELEENDLRSLLAEIGAIKAFQLLRERDLGKSAGVAFVEFADDISLLTSKTLALPLVTRAYYGCMGAVQTVAATGELLPKLVHRQGISEHRKLLVVQFVNCVTGADLVDDDNYEFVVADFRHELAKIAPVVSMVIPRPPQGYVMGLADDLPRGLGKVFVEFDSPELAFEVINKVAGRQYNDRTVLCGYFDADDYKLGLY